MTDGMRIPHTPWISDLPRNSKIAPCRGRSLWLALLLWLGSALPVMAGETDAWILRGTIVLNGQSGYAIVEQAGQQAQYWRRTGANILPGMPLAAVFADHAIVIQHGKRKRINFGARLATATPPPVAGNYHIDPLRIPEIAAAVDIIPHQQNGRVDGYYANGIPAVLRAQIGLQPGDLLRRINGIPLDDKTDPARLYEMFLSGQMNVEVMRRGQTVQLLYQLGS